MKTKSKMPQRRTRENRVVICMTDAERAKIATASVISGLSMTAWCRTRLLGIANTEIAGTS